MTNLIITTTEGTPMHSKLYGRLLAIATLGISAAIVSVVAAPASADTVVNLSALNGATTPTAFTLHVDTAGATSAKLVLDGVFIGEDTSPPLDFSVSVATGTHKAKVRPVVGGVEGRVDADFTASGTAPTTTAPATTTTTAGTTTTTAPTTSTTTAPTTTVPGGPAIDTVQEIRDAVANAQPGDTVTVAPGTYVIHPRLVVSASGSASQPITLNAAGVTIQSTSISKDYGVHITGDYWHINDLRVTTATKGIVMDGARGTVLTSIEVANVGEEGVHFRTCSSDGVIQDSWVHDTGQNKARYGEGIYVGSANANWSKYKCLDPIEGTFPQGDNTERVQVLDNLIEDTTAEGIDIKEATDSGTVSGNTFNNAGISGENSADSAIDAKGNNWAIDGNTVNFDPNATWYSDGATHASEFLDGYQVHDVWSGYGANNVFTNNVVNGAVPGFGFGLQHQLGNVVYCNNTAPDAVRGLVGVGNQPSTCTP